MNLAAFVLFTVTVIFSKVCVDATICKPLSTFKIDCDECQCSEDGTEYSCTVRKCRPTSFLDIDDEDGFVLERSKLPLDPRSAKLEIPFINDEIPPSGEVIDNEFAANDLYDEIKNSNDENSENDNHGGESFQDVGLEEQDASSIFDTGLPDEYRHKRYIKPHGKRYIRPHGKRYIRPHGRK